MERTISSDKRDDRLEKVKDAIITHKIEADEIMELVDICIISGQDLKDKVLGGINSVLANADRDEVVNEVVEYVLNNYTSNKMVNYLESRKDTNNDQ